jgi:hypothetical protein
LRTLHEATKWSLAVRNDREQVFGMVDVLSLICSNGPSVVLAPVDKGVHVFV